MIKEEKMRRILLVLLLFFLTVSVFAQKHTALAELVNPDSIAVDQNQVYITEGTNIYIYDLENFKMKKKFGKRGEGPKEFMENRQTGNPPLTINVQTKNIIVNSLNKISFFSKDGKFKNEQKIGAFSDRFIPLGKGFAAQTLITEEGKRYWTLDIYDSNINKVKEVFKIKHHFQGLGKGFKVLQESRLYAAYDDKLFVAWVKEFNIQVFDSLGEKLYSINFNYKRAPVTEEDRKRIIEYFKTNPRTKELYEVIKPIHFPRYYPALGNMRINDGKIYAITFEKSNGKPKCFIFDLKGKLLKEVFLDLKAMDIFALYPFTINNGNIYQLVESEDETWELYINCIK
jgi:hypothetical protein